MARHGHTQVSLAKKLGVTQQMLSRRLSGHVDFGITELHAIANVLGVPLANLIDTDKANAS
jgi:transcriptional regulator with XRE-family HTH domain